MFIIMGMLDLKWVCSGVGAPSGQVGGQATHFLWVGPRRGPPLWYMFKSGVLMEVGGVIKGGWESLKGTRETLVQVNISGKVVEAIRLCKVNTTDSTFYAKL